MLLKVTNEVKVEEEKRKKELSSEFTTLNKQQKDYILGLTRALANVAKKWPWISAPSEKKGSGKEILPGTVQKKV